MGKHYRYGSYHGQSKTRSVLTGIAIFLAVLLVLVIAAVMYLGQYMVYTSDGAYLDLPFLKNEPPAVTTPVTTVPEPSTVVTTPEPTPTPMLVVHASALPRTALTDGTAPLQLQTDGSNAAWFDMKSDDGTLGYVSGLELATAAKASAADPTLNAAIQALNDTEDLYTIARVSCFKDHLISDAERSLSILTNSGYRWTDPQKVRWGSPTSPMVRKYLADICGELAALGFDEILLDNAGYPTTGNLGYIKVGADYDPNGLSAVVTSFYAEVKAALADYPDVKLSIVAGDGVLAGTDALSGQTVHNLKTAHRIWATPANSLQPVTSSLAFDVVSLDSEPQGKDISWAIWPE